MIEFIADRIQGKILFLWGQWLYDPHVFPDSLWHQSSGDDKLTFPSSRFILQRSVALGRVLRVELSGPLVLPIRTLPADEIPLHGLRESEIIEGSLDNLHEVMARFTTTRQLP